MVASNYEDLKKEASELYNWLKNAHGELRSIRRQINKLKGNKIDWLSIALDQINSSSKPITCVEIYEQYFNGQKIGEVDRRCHIQDISVALHRLWKREKVLSFRVEGKKGWRYISVDKKQYPMSNCAVMPPVGLMPHWLYLELCAKYSIEDHLRRKWQIVQAIHRYVARLRPIPEEWINELKSYK